MWTNTLHEKYSTTDLIINCFTTVCFLQDVIKCGFRSYEYCLRQELEGYIAPPVDHIAQHSLHLCVRFLRKGIVYLVKDQNFPAKM